MDVESSSGIKLNSVTSQKTGTLMSSDDWIWRYESRTCKQEASELLGRSLHRNSLEKSLFFSWRFLDIHFSAAMKFQMHYDNVMNT
jgi:hypothetical protein